MMKKYSALLVSRARLYFRQKYQKEFSDEEIQEALDRLAELYLLFSETSSNGVDLVRPAGGSPPTDLIYVPLTNQPKD